MVGGCAREREGNNTHTMIDLVCQVFDVTRKITYKNLAHWYEELRLNRPKIPCLLVANKIDGQ